MNGELNIPWMIPKGGFYQMNMFLGFESYTDFFQAKDGFLPQFTVTIQHLRYHY